MTRILTEVERQNSLLIYLYTEFGPGWTSRFYNPQSQYCRHCKAELVDTVQNEGYDPVTGKVKFEIARQCPRTLGFFNYWRTFWTH